MAATGVRAFWNYENPPSTKTESRNLDIRNREDGISKIWGISKIQGLTRAPSPITFGKPRFPRETEVRDGRVRTAPGQRRSWSLVIAMAATGVRSLGDYGNPFSTETDSRNPRIRNRADGTSRIRAAYRDFEPRPGGWHFQNSHARPGRFAKPPLPKPGG